MTETRGHATGGGCLECARSVGPAVEAIMTYRGHVKNGQVVLDDPARLPEGAEVKVEVVEDGDGKPPIWGELLKLVGTVQGLPPDMAQEHDHYLHGTPKKK